MTDLSMTVDVGPKDDRHSNASMQSGSTRRRDACTRRLSVSRRKQEPNCACPSTQRLYEPPEQARHEQSKMSAHGFFPLLTLTLSLASHSPYSRSSQQRRELRRLVSPSVIPLLLPCHLPIQRTTGTILRGREEEFRSELSKVPAQGFGQAARDEEPKGEKISVRCSGWRIMRE